MNGYTLAEILASGCPVELEDAGEACDRCGGAEAVVLTQWARLCHPCHEDAWRRDVGYARLAEQRFPEWLAAVKEGFAEGVFEDLDGGELDDALEELAGWSAERMLRTRR